MTPDASMQLTPRMEAAIDEFKGLISRHYPEATFDVGEGDDPEGIYLRATIDVEDLDDVVDVFIDRMVELQVEEELPIFVIPVRTPERNAAILAQREALVVEEPTAV